MSSQTPSTIAAKISHLASYFSPGETSRPTDALELYEAKFLIQDLCSQLVRSVLGTPEYTILLAESCQESSALGFVNSLNIADAIGDSKASVLELSERTGADPKFIGIAMNCLLKHGYFEEIGGFGSQVYTNNAMSEILRKGHSESVKDAIGFICDEGFRATSHLVEAAKTPATGGKPSPPAVNLAYGFEKPVFEWMSDQPWRAQRLGKAMQQLHRTANGNVANDYSWNKLLSPVVDVGGGIGSLEMMLLKDEQNASLLFTIFDIPGTIENAKKAWNAQPPQASSRVSFISGNFMAASLDDTGLPRGQPTYLIRHVLHDWTDEQVITILRNVRAAMISAPDRSPAQKLVVCEMLLREASPRFVYTTSMQLLALNNGITRTEAHMIALIEQSGFIVQGVHHMRAVDSILEAVPTY